MGAKSFQKLDLRYSWMNADDGFEPDPNLFTLNSETGEITLRTAQVYVSDPHQHRFNLTVREEWSNFESMVSVCIAAVTFL